MTETLKILAQAPSTSATNYTAYTVTATSAIISTISLCNTGSSDDTVRIYTVKSGDTTSVKNALYYNLPIYANETFASTLGITLSTGDNIVIYSALSSLIGIQIFGSEIT